MGAHVSIWWLWVWTWTVLICTQNPLWWHWTEEDHWRYQPQEYIQQAFPHRIKLERHTAHVQVTIPVICIPTLTKSYYYLSKSPATHWSGILTYAKTNTFWHMTFQVHCHRISWYLILYLSRIYPSYLFNDILVYLFQPPSTQHRSGILTYANTKTFLTHDVSSSLPQNIKYQFRQWYLSCTFLVAIPVIWHISLPFPTSSFEHWKRDIDIHTNKRLFDTSSFKFIAREYQIAVEAIVAINKPLSRLIQSYLSGNELSTLKQTSQTLRISTCISCEVLQPHA